MLELVVVVAIIGLLAALVLPRLSGAMDSARLTPGKADQVIISSALERYYTDRMAYPTGETANEVISELRGGYLKATTTFRNGFNQGYLYLIPSDSWHYWLIDLQGERQDDLPELAGDQILVRCSNGDPAYDVERVFTVQTGPEATLTLPEAPAPGYSWQVDDWLWPFCQLANPNPGFRILTSEG